MTGVTLEEITRSVSASFDGTTDPRSRAIAQSLVRHLHAFVSEVRPAQDEWMQAIEFLTAIGHKCQGERQEFILLSDVLGVSMLVETINQADHHAATEGTVLGPFYVDYPPLLEEGADLSAGAEGKPLWIDIAVTDTEGAPVAGALVDIWHSDDGGLYDIQLEHLAEGETAFRGRFISDAAGRVRCWTTAPIAYMVPVDGPVGDLLGATQRNPWRPAHVHFRIAAPGHRPLTTHLFTAGSKYLDDDAVFGSNRR